MNKEFLLVILSRDINLKWKETSQSCSSDMPTRDKKHLSKMSEL